jgi:uncharacterized surface protein with fasciclin (FAS1) repeats
MINKVLLGLIAALAIGIVVVGSADKARQQPAAAITALSEKAIDTPITAESLKGDTSISTSTNLSTFVSIAEAVGLTDILKEKGGEYTIFAPTNAAFEKFTPGGVTGLLATESKDSLTALMMYHVVPGHYSAKELTDGTVLTTLQGEKLTVSNVKGVITINGVGTIASSEATADGSIVHVINNVLVSSTDSLVAETTGPVKADESADVSMQTLCTDNKDGTVTLQSQEYSGWWIFAGWHDKGEPTNEKGTCADIKGAIIDQDNARRQDKRSCSYDSASGQVVYGVKRWSGWFIFGGWEWLPSYPRTEPAASQEIANELCNAWMNDGVNAY